MRITLVVPDSGSGAPATLQIDQSPPQPMTPQAALAQIQRLVGAQAHAGPQGEPTDGAQPAPEGDGDADDAPEGQGMEPGQIPTQQQMWQDEADARMRRRVQVLDMAA